MADANAVMVSSVLESLLMEVKRDTFAVFEFNYPGDKDPRVYIVIT